MHKTPNKSGANRLTIDEALILAGGFGMRLKTLVTDKPKPMADIAGRPFLEYLLEYFIYQGVKKFTLLTGHLGSIIEQHFGDSFQGSSISYLQENKPLGTGGAIRYALANQKNLNENLLVINGDTWFEVKPDLLFAINRKTKKPITICCKKTVLNSRFGGLKLDKNNIVTQFGLSHEQSSLINGGCYIINKTFFNTYFAKYPESFSFEKDALPNLASQGQMSGGIQDGLFIDIGIPEDYLLSQTIIPERIGKILRKNER